MTGEAEKKPRNNGRKTASGTAYNGAKDGRFREGNPGRPRGARHKATVAAQALIDGAGERITRKVIEAAEAGDMVALRLVMDRLVPPRKEAPIQVNLPEMKTATDAAQAMAAIIAEVASGEITASEATALIRSINDFTQTLTATEFEKRLEALENAETES